MTKPVLLCSTYMPGQLPKTPRVPHGFAGTMTVYEEEPEFKYVFFDDYMYYLPMPWLYYFYWNHDALVPMIQAIFASPCQLTSTQDTVGMLPLPNCSRYGLCYPYQGLDFPTEYNIFWSSEFNFDNWESFMLTSLFKWIMVEFNISVYYDETASEIFGAWETLSLTQVADHLLSDLDKNNREYALATAISYSSRLFAPCILDIQQALTQRKKHHATG